MEPGSKRPSASYEECWTILCPVLYCGANPGMPCMNAKGYFALRTHVKRREYYENAQGETKMGWGGGRMKRPAGLYGEISDFERNEELITALDGLDGHITTRWLDQQVIDPEDFDPFWDLDDEFFDECS